MTHLHTLGWTSDNGCNVFALGWLTIASILFTPGGGLDDSPLPLDKRSREEQEFLALLIMVVSVIEQERDS